MRLVEATVLLLAVVNGVCQQPRIRKSYDTMAAEGTAQTYIAAVNEAIARGLHQEFATEHSRQADPTMDHHQKSTFINWHRRFILAYEDMLRSLAPEYECVTIPYWNYYYENNLLIASGGKLLDVSAICQDLPQGSATRTNWNDLDTFPGIGMASTIATLDLDDFEEMSSNLEFTVHNGIHNWLGGTMATYDSAQDPIFYSHHATIDMLHSIHYDCKAERNQPDTFKSTSPIAYSPWEMDQRLQITLKLVPRL